LVLDARAFGPGISSENVTSYGFMDSITMAIKHAKIVIPAEAGISSLPGQGLQEDPGFRRDGDIVGLFGCRSNNIAVAACAGQYPLAKTLTATRVRFSLIHPRIPVTKEDGS